MKPVSPQRTVLTLVATLLLAFVAYATTTVQYFTANYVGTDVKLEWRVGDDASVEFFEVARKRPDETAFTRITSMNANGTGLYTFVDDQLYKSGQASTVSYRLTMKSSAGVSTHITSIAHNPTAVQRTWGSIKSMFK